MSLGSVVFKQCCVYHYIGELTHSGLGQLISSSLALARSFRSSSTSGLDDLAMANMSFDSCSGSAMSPLRSEQLQTAGRAIKRGAKTACRSRRIGSYGCRLENLDLIELATICNSVSALNQTIGIALLH